MTHPSSHPFGARDVDIERVEHAAGARLPSALRDRLATTNGCEIDDSAGITGQSWTILPVLDRSDRKRMTATAHDMVHATTKARALDRVASVGFGEPEPGHPFPSTAIVIGHSYSPDVRLALDIDPEDPSRFADALFVQRHLLPMAPLGVTLDQLGPDPLSAETGEELPVFRYHPDPVTSGSITRTTVACAVCERPRGWKYGATDPAVCPWCLADGSAAASLEWGLYADIDGDLNAEIVREVAQRTPWFVSWQQARWLDHCDDAAAFIAPVGWEQLRDKPTAVRRLVADGWPEHALEYLDADGDLVAYLFRCLHCGEYLAYADAS